MLHGQIEKRNTPDASFLGKNLEERARPCLCIFRCVTRWETDQVLLQAFKPTISLARRGSPNQTVRSIMDQDQIRRVIEHLLHNHLSMMCHHVFRALMLTLILTHQRRQAP